jgi:hypothetical protein
VAAAYLVRSGIRGWDFRPDLPIDAVLVAALVALIALRAMIARSLATHGDGDADVRDARDDADTPPSDVPPVDAG